MQMLEKLIVRYFPLLWKKKKKENKKKEENFLVAVNNNPLTHLAKTYKKCESSFNNWVAQRSQPVEAAITTVSGAIPGAAFGVCFTTLTDHVLPTFSIPSRPGTSNDSQSNNMTSWPSSLAPYKVIISGGTLEVARNFAVLTSVDVGISHVMQKIRGKKDVKTCMMAGFGSGVMLSLVSGMRGQNAISVGLVVALLKSGAFTVKEKVNKKVKENSLRQQAEDAKYKRIKRMLSVLGLTRYENNFKRNDLHDLTLFSLHYTALRQVGIPVGKSIAILNHIKYYGHEYILG